MLFEVSYQIRTNWLPSRFSFTYGVPMFTVETLYLKSITKQNKKTKVMMDSYVDVKLVLMMTF